MANKGHILVDFDHTLATYTSFAVQGRELGHPIPAMVERVRRWLVMGKDVRIFTARASRVGADNMAELLDIEHWCEDVFGVVLPIQNYKDFDTEAIWDNLAVTVEENTGWRSTASGPVLSGGDPLTIQEERKLTSQEAIDSSTH